LGRGFAKLVTGKRIFRRADRTSGNFIEASAARCRGGKVTYVEEAKSSIISLEG